MHSPITDQDRAWVASVAGHPVTDDEVIEFKLEYEAWCALQKEDFEDLLEGLFGLN